MKTLTYSLLFFLLIFSCSKEKKQVIPDEIKKYVDLFFLEGNLRDNDVSINDEELIIEFGLPDNGAIGQCAFSSNKITLDETKWKAMDENKKTWVIFHELGHCILERRHRNEKAITGECLSIMGGKEDQFDCSTNFYSERWWKYYLDELFEPTIPWPNWYVDYEDYSSIAFGENVVTIDTVSDYLEINDLDFGAYSNYNIDFEFENWDTEDVSAKFNFGNIVFSTCNICTGTNLRISSDEPDNLFFKNGDGEFQFSTDSKLTIRKVEKELYFYVNEVYVHAFECELWSGNSQISTTHFEEPIGMKLKINKIE